MIKKLVLVGLLATASIILPMSFGKSFLATPVSFRPTTPEMVGAVRRPLMLSDLNENRQNLSIIGIAGSSFHSDHTARYFLPHTGHNPDDILVAGEPGSDAAQYQRLDLQAKYFNVLTAPLPDNGDEYVPSQYTFQSQLNFKPQQIFSGMAIDYRYHLSPYLDHGYWVRLLVPILQVKNTMGMSEQITTPGGPTGQNPIVPPGYCANMVEAFKQSSWSFGKIDGAQTKFGLGDIQIELGYIYMNEKHYFLNSFLGMLVPTSNKPSAEFMFEPVLGHHGHPGLFTGSSAGVRIWAQCDRALYWMIDTQAMFFFDNNQLRSIDLQGRPWSRYMSVYLSSDATQMNPGINSFTLPVTVTAGSIRDLNTAFTYQHGNLVAEAGYHYYAKQAEKLKLLHSIGNSLAIASDVEVEIGSGVEELIYRGPSGNIKLSKDQASINRYLLVNNDVNQAGQDTYTPLTDDDLDLNSAAHPGAISNIFYGAVSYQWSDRPHPVLLALGVGCEFGSNDAAIERISGWGRFELTF